MVDVATLPWDLNRMTPPANLDLSLREVMARTMRLYLNFCYVRHAISQYRTSAASTFLALHIMSPGEESPFRFWAEMYRILTMMDD